MTSFVRRVAEAIGIAVAVAVAAMIVRGGPFVLRALVIIGIFVVDFLLDVSRVRERPRP